MDNNGKAAPMGKYHQKWYGLLCLVLIASAVAFVYVFPMSSDESNADSDQLYSLSGGIYNDFTSDQLEEILYLIDEGGAGISYLITVYGNDVLISGLTISNDVTITSSNGSKFTLTSADGARHFTVAGSLTLTNIILNGGNSGGGVENHGTLIMNSGAEIRNCSNLQGGGVYSSGTFIMNGGVISDNTAINPGVISYNNGGGGVYNTGNFTMKDGAVISNNKAASAGSPHIFYYGGGGVYNTGTFTMLGGEISNNNTSNEPMYDDNCGGGGVYNYNGTVTMSGGKIGDNTAKRGGGVYNLDAATLTINNAEISGNTAIYGGGVYNLGTLTMNSGAKISKNSSIYVNPPGGGDGGGVYNYKIVTINEGAEISNNTSEANGGGIYSYGALIVNGVLSVAVITMNGGKISNNSAQTVAPYGSGGGLALVSNCTFNMNGGEISGNTSGFAGNAVYAYGGCTFTMSNGTISGHNGGDYGSVCIDGSTFTMTGGKISNNTSKNGGGVYNGYALSGSSTFTMSGGEISGNNATYGGGVYNYYYSTFTMSGGKIYGNYSSYYGGGVYITGYSTFTMNGGEIGSNRSGGYGGGVYNYYNTFEMNAGTVSGNRAALGGGIYNSIYGNTFINGGTISGNIATAYNTGGSGGGIYTENFAKLKVKDGVIFTGNTAPTLRIMMISATADIDGNGIYDLTDYGNIGLLVLDALVNKGQNAPAYNNFDINYPGDVYVVQIFITPSGGGGVSVAYITVNGEVNETFTTETCIYVPIAVDKISISASAANGHDLIQLTIDGTPSSGDDLAARNMKAVAEFTALAAPPGHNDYYITATADGGSEINPSGTITVTSGGDRTFGFSAKPGYQITAVYVDGVAISNAELTSGRYTFHNVLSNHSIRVSSETGGNMGGGDNPGEGTGTGTGSGGSGESKWAVLNLICAVLAVFTGLIALAAVRKRKDDDERPKTALILGALALIIGIVSVIMFLLTEDLSQPVASADGWTLLMFVLFLATLILALVSFRRSDKKDDEKPGRD